MISYSLIAADEKRGSMVLRWCNALWDRIGATTDRGRLSQSNNRSVGDGQWPILKAQHGLLGKTPWPRIVSISERSRIDSAFRP